MTKPDSIIETIVGYRKAKVLMVAASLDCFTFLERPATARQAAAGLRIHPRAAEILLDALASMDLLAKREGVYRNSPLASRFLVRGRRGFLGDNLKYQEIIWDAWSELAAALKKGGAVRPLEYWLLKHRGFAEEYIRGMDNIAKKPSREIARAVRCAEARSLLDVGAGPGTYARAFLERNPGLRATLLDLPVTLKITRQILRKHPRAAARTTLVPGDYKKAPFGRGRHDLVLMSHITHDESPRTNGQLARKCFAALRPGGKVIVHDFMVDEDRVRPAFGALFSVHMLTYTRGGRTYTAGEYRQWLREAGFRRLEQRKIVPEAKNATEIIVGTR